MTRAPVPPGVAPPRNGGPYRTPSVVVVDLTPLEVAQALAEFALRKVGAYPAGPRRYQVRAELDSEHGATIRIEDGVA